MLLPKIAPARFGCRDLSFAFSGGSSETLASGISRRSSMAIIDVSLDFPALPCLSPIILGSSPIVAPLWGPPDRRSGDATRTANSRRLAASPTRLYYTKNSFFFWLPPAGDPGNPSGPASRGRPFGTAPRGRPPGHNSTRAGGYRKRS